VLGTVYTAARYTRAVTASLLQSTYDKLLQVLLPVTMLLYLKSETVIFGHINRSYYLLAYLLTGSALYAE